MGSAATWVTLISALAALLGTGGIIITPRLRRHVGAQADLTEFERRERQTRLDIDLLREIATRSQADISQLQAERNILRDELQKLKIRHEEQIEEYERRITRLVGTVHTLEDQNGRQLRELAAIRKRIE